MCVCVCVCVCVCLQYVLRRRHKHKFIFNVHIDLLPGAYAILRAFIDLSALNRSVTKDELCRAGQDHCDDPMEANYLAGQQFGAWKVRLLYWWGSTVPENT